jgi:hypothetical protein
MAAQNEHSSISQFLLSGVIVSGFLAVKFWHLGLGNFDGQQASKVEAQNTRPPFVSLQLPQSLAIGSDKTPLLDATIESRISPLGSNDSLICHGNLRAEIRSKEIIGVPDLVELLKRGGPQALKAKRNNE